MRASEIRVKQIRVNQGLGVEQLEFKLEKNIGIQKHAGKVRKNY